MRILVLSPYLPHPLSGHGGGEYVYGLVKHLSQSHEVTLVSFANHHEQELADDLRALPIKVLLVTRWKGKQERLGASLLLAGLRLFQLVRSVILWQPYYVSKFYHPKMAKLIEEETRNTKYDIVQVEFAQMGQYVRFIRSGKPVLRAHDVVFRPAYRNYRSAGSVVRKLALFVEWCRWAQYEPRMVKRYDHVLTFTEQDRALLQRLAGIKQVTYNARGIEVPSAIVPYEERDTRTLLFVGAFDHSPNVDAALWLCSEVYPLVCKECPDVRLRLVGKNPPSALRTVAEKYPSMELLGFVSDLEKHYHSASIFVAPIRTGGGIKTKIIHAQSYGVPVVTTPLGAEGIEGTVNNSTLVLGRTAEELAAGILSLLRDRWKASSIGRKGRETAIVSYAWETTIRKQIAIYRSLLSTNHHNIGREDV